MPTLMAIFTACGCCYEITRLTWRDRSLQSWYCNNGSQKVNLCIECIVVLGVQVTLHITLCPQGLSATYHNGIQTFFVCQWPDWQHACCKEGALFYVTYLPVKRCSRSLSLLNWNATSSGDWVSQHEQITWRWKLKILYQSAVNSRPIRGFTLSPSIC